MELHGLLGLLIYRPQRDGRLSWPDREWPVLRMGGVVCIGLYDLILLSLLLDSANVKQHPIFDKKITAGRTR